MELLAFTKGCLIPAAVTKARGLLHQGEKFTPTLEMQEPTTLREGEKSTLILEKREPVTRHHSIETSIKRKVSLATLRLHTAPLGYCRLENLHAKMLLL